MKRIILRSLLALSFQALLLSAVHARHATKLTVTDISDDTVSQKINVGVSALLTEFDAAFREKRTLSLKGIRTLSKDGENAILATWEATGAFRCVESEIVARGLRSATGYQVRNIPVVLQDRRETDTLQKIVIFFDGRGNIDDICFVLNLDEFDRKGKNGDDIIDLRRRQAILNFVENLHVAYSRKDIDRLAEVYDDEALIITGKMVRIPTYEDEDIPASPQMRYQLFTKREYIDSLRTVFSTIPRINVLFDSIEVTLHSKRDNIYGILLRQSWNTSDYGDLGYLFLVTDFKDGENMTVLVRTWQPENSGDKDLFEDEIFRLEDFIIK